MTGPRCCCTCSDARKCHHVCLSLCWEFPIRTPLQWRRPGVPVGWVFNRNIVITCTVLKLVVVCVTEAKLGALFLRIQEARRLRLIIFVRWDIFNNTIKGQHSHVIEMRYFWLLGQTTQQYIKVYYQPGAENMSDYLSKAHTDYPQLCQALTCADGELSRRALKSSKAKRIARMC